MLKNLLTYLFAFLFLTNLVSPLIAAFILDQHQDTEIVFDFFDSEKEESSEEGENETKDHKEKEKSEDEKLKNRLDRHNRMSLDGMVKIKQSDSKQIYFSFISTVPTPPPRV